MAVKLSGLSLSYLPVEKKRRRSGFGSWWLGRVDKANMEFPTDEELRRLFGDKSEGGQIQIESRKPNHLILLIPTRTKTTVLRKFLRAINTYR